MDVGVVAYRPTSAFASADAGIVRIQGGTETQRTTARSPLTIISSFTSGLMNDPVVGRGVVPPGDG
jgi:hypothetical protein